jgi:hypothetical protein
MSERHIASLKISEKAQRLLSLLTFQIRHTASLEMSEKAHSFFEDIRKGAQLP